MEASVSQALRFGGRILAEGDAYLSLAALYEAEASVATLDVARLLRQSAS
jgi:hypothetical protein